ncbi:MAG TPA: class I tRNA ligase family protein, partial [Cyclobacteriaceae bacterium]|nr:class I tRNA ligase family protein [Cyclobacteriaceae bacterium]
MADYSKQEIKSIEEKWQKHWEAQGIYKVNTEPGKPKYYVLDMFPYPSGAGLHVGHPLGYIATDIVSRFKRLKGYNVLHPMGFDAFGLPAEQYAIQTGQHPAITTAKNIETYIRQLKQLGFSYDWDREVQTCAPDYYKWTQWIFMQIFNSWYNKKGVDNRQLAVDSDKGNPVSSLGRAEHISSLIEELEKHGNKNIEAACDEDTPIITADDWKSFDEKQKEDFLQHYRLAYQSEQVVNWCAALGTVLSNDEVKDGVSERGGYPVERIKMLQWSMRITAYAERLLQGLDTIDWREAVKEMQRNWIGKSVGAQFKFQISNSKSQIEVFTTRIDTIYGVSFVVLAPEHELVEQITTDAQRDEVMQYVEMAKNRSERERMSEVKRVSGVFTGAYLTHPFTNEQLPIWIADYVLAGYGTGAVMAVPGHDERDHRFAKHFNLPIPKVVEGPDVDEEAFVSWDAKIINSDFMNGLTVEEAIQAGIKKLEEMGIGYGKVNYRMRDAIFGRQRYWGEPFPVYFKDGIPKLVEEKDLPITLPEIDEYKPTESGEPPLGRAKNWRYTLTPSTLERGPGGEVHPFELTTMPGWAGSSWYWYRYMDPKNKNAFCGKEAQAYWQDVDLYMGGAEHATGHLLYARFWNKILKDLGHVQAEEPFKKLINQGMIQGVSKFVYRVGSNIYLSKSWFDKLKSLDYYDDQHVLTEYGQRFNKILGKQLFDVGGTLMQFSFDEKHSFANSGLFNITEINIDIALYDDNKGLDFEGLKNWRPEFSNALFIKEEEGRYICGSEIEKMSKSKHNVVNPDDIVNEYGADTLRMYEMFLGPIEQSKPWNTHGIDGVFKFLRRFWNLFHDAQGNFAVTDIAPTNDELKVLHKTLKKIETDIERYSFNTCVSEFMICANELSALKCNKRAVLEPLLIALAPFAPHITEELWQKLGHNSSVHATAYPAWDEQYLKEDAFDYPVSINGKTRTFIKFPLDMPKEDMEKQVLANEVVLKWTEG